MLLGDYLSTCGMQSRATAHDADATLQTMKSGLVGCIREAMHRIYFESKQAYCRGKRSFAPTNRGDAPY